MPRRIRGRHAAALALVCITTGPPPGRAVLPASQPAVRPAVLAGDGAVGTRATDTSNLLGAGDVRSFYGVSGAGLSVAVLDTGLRTTHQDFAGRVVAQHNFSRDNGGDPEDVTDQNGHGTHVTGVIAAGGVHTGMAPGAGIVSLKVFPNFGGGSFGDVLRGLQWIRENRTAVDPPISVAVISLTDRQNYASYAADGFQGELQALRAQRVAVVCAAGNLYAQFREPGLGYPAIFPETLSVGAVYDADLGPQEYPQLGGAAANTTGPDRLTAFTQRLHPTQSPGFGTDLLAPGANLVSSGIRDDAASAELTGTSQSTPVVAGIVALLQEQYLRRRGTLPSVDQLERWLKSGGTTVKDGDDEDDNVPHPSPALVYSRVDPAGAFREMLRELDSNVPPEPEDDAPPKAPARLKAASQGSGKVELTWDDRSRNEHGFTLEYGFNRKKMKPLVQVGPNTARVEINGVRSRTTYFFRVRAFNQFGKSRSSNVTRLRIAGGRGR